MSVKWPYLPKSDVKKKFYLLTHQRKIYFSFSLYIYDVCVDSQNISHFLLQMPFYFVHFVPIRKFYKLSAFQLILLRACVIDLSTIVCAFMLLLKLFDSAGFLLN